MSGQESNAIIPPDTPPQSGATPVPIETAEEEMVITSTPPRPGRNERNLLSELDTPISGTALTTDNEADDAVVWKLPPPLTNPNMVGTGGRRTARDGLSVTSSMYSVASGLVNTSAPGEDLAGLVVRMNPSEEESSLVTSNSAPTTSLPRKPASKTTSNPSAGGDDFTDAMQSMTTDLKRHLDKTLVELRDQSRRDFEKVLSVLQQESAKRTALEGRLHSQLLMQSETMVAMELKLLKLEAKLERKEAAARAQKSRPTPFRTIDETSYGQIQVQRPPGSRLPPPPRQVSDTEPTNIAVISSGASLASGVTAEGFMEDGADEEHEHSVATGDDATDDVANDGSESTPQSRGNPFGSTNLESILLNPMIGESSLHGTSTHATRGDDNDGNSSLNTSVTNVTNSTLATATTRGESVNINRRSLLDEGGISEEGPAVVRGRGSSTAILMEEEDGFESLSGRQPRSRSQSPLTIQSGMASQVEAPSITSASLGVGSILSNVAVAPPRSFGSRRAYAAATNSNTISSIAMNGETSTRPLANRVVSFTTEALQTPQVGNYSEAGDSITMPDELDNLSEVADTFATSARVWREEYEARLDALQKRWSNE